jgi:hypothetical protein
MCIECLLNILAENIQKLTVLTITETVLTKITDFKDNRKFSIMIPFLGLSIMWQWDAVPRLQRNLAVSILLQLEQKCSHYTGRQSVRPTGRLEWVSAWSGPVGIMTNSPF